MAIRGFKILLPAALLALVFFTGLYRWNPFLVIGMAAGCGLSIAGHVGYVASSGAAEVASPRPTGRAGFARYLRGSGAGPGPGASCESPRS